ncbi:hypothetical protein SAMN05444411_101349 [Lutibacter oricola]|uniref:Uncharacterized protein n=1 Tax=Lutibacter oricola TaxID=762486 RepID=A0A1H2S0Z2_9FLAO|nr:hypothetical protein SAMN05444411_101349 [Lutibacter oricola]
MNNGINKKQLLIAVVVFLGSFVLAREFFANSESIKTFLFGN